MDKTETLKDGTKVHIRDLKPADLDALMKFYGRLPHEDRLYLKIDVTNREAVKQRIKRMEAGNFDRIIALDGDEIIAEGGLELTAEEWSRHQAEIRVIVSESSRRRGLGLILMRELHHLAAGKNIEMVVARFMRPQEAARKICRRLGFHEEVLLPDYVKDQAGKSQDLVIMIADMKEFWNELESFYADSDWQRCK